MILKNQSLMIYGYWILWLRKKLPKAILYNLQEIIMANNNPHIAPIAINQVVSSWGVLEVVTVFTGDSISLEKFTEGYREVRNMLPAGTDQNLIKLIKTKIKGIIEEMISNIKRVYSLNKSVCQLQEEQGNIYQWDGKKVIAYL